VIHPDDLKKLALAALLVCSAIAAHSLNIPVSWEPARPYVEFISGAGAIVTAFYMRSPNQGDNR
jgi:hypothetical protein